MAMARAVVATACVDADDRAAKTTTLTAHDAIDIYLAKASRSARDSLTSVLSKRYNITMKAVRDVWNLRTWAWATMPFWTRSDLEKFLRKHLCAQCKTNGVTSLASACAQNLAAVAGPVAQASSPRRCALTPPIRG